MSNYTQEQTDYMVEIYSKNPNRETVEQAFVRVDDKK
jgi:protein tyrosine/serine phosphatase